MLTKDTKLIWMVCLIFSSASGAFANESLAEFSQHSNISQRTIVGQAYFEQRITRVVEEECDSVPCKTPEVYWTLVVRSKKTQFILNEKLNVGDSTPPRVITLDGVRVREGSTVRVEGEVQFLASETYLFHKINRVKLIIDLGWSCSSIDSTVPGIYARVWHDPILPAPRDDSRMIYKMRVQEVVDRDIRPIAYVKDVEISVRGANWVFGGNSSIPAESAVELRIQSNASEVESVPAELKIGLNSSTGIKLKTVEMSCSRTRTL